MLPLQISINQTIMKQIFECSENELWQQYRQYIAAGILKRAAMCLERLLFLGNLRRYGYLRLIYINAKMGEETAIERIYQRYIMIYKNI